MKLRIIFLLLILTFISCKRDPFIFYADYPINISSTTLPDSAKLGDTIIYTINYTFKCPLADSLKFEQNSESNTHTIKFFDIKPKNTEGRGYQDDNACVGFKDTTWSFYPTLIGKNYFKFKRWRENYLLDTLIVY